MTTYRWGDRVVWKHDGRTWAATVVGNAEDGVEIDLDEDGLTYCGIAEVDLQPMPLYIRDLAPPKVGKL